MNLELRHFNDLDSWVEISSYRPAGQSLDSVHEIMLAIHVKGEGKSFPEQLKSLLTTYTRCQKDAIGCQAITSRIFMSDAANQEAAILDQLPDTLGVVSIIEQPPLDGSKICLWVYMQSQMSAQILPSGLRQYSHGAYKHYWGSASATGQSNSETQGIELFEKLTEQLNEQDCTLEANCHRTWIYVQHIDANYAGLVRGRNKHFDEQNLTAETHFISSTGIQGRRAATNSLVQLDSYSVSGLAVEQIQYLKAPSHLNNTHDYGVRFERGTTIHYGDRAHSFISGTASIDNRGEVLHTGDISKQTERMMENIDYLLAEAGGSSQDIAQMFIYLRDVADYNISRDYFEARFPMLPKQYLLAPVCRQTWLIEVECIAIHRTQQPDAPAL